MQTTVITQYGVLLGATHPRGITVFKGIGPCHFTEFVFAFNNIQSKLMMPLLGPDPPRAVERKLWNGRH